MLPSRLALCFVLFVSADAMGQLPPAPDAERYPQLAAMKRWLESGVDDARRCALSGGLFQEASELFRSNRSEPKTVEALMRRHGEPLVAADRERLRPTIAHVAGMASGFADLHADSAPIAYLQLCIGRAQNPRATLSTDSIRAQFDAALRCQRAQAAGSLELKECVAVAFKL